MMHCEEMRMKIMKVIWNFEMASRTWGFAKKIDPVIANELKRDLSIPTSEFGIWYGCYALIFQPEGDKTRLWLAYPGESMYRECEEYFRRLNNKAREFTTELFDEKLAENWEEFIWPEKRWETEKDFLLKILEPYRNGVILDAAAGIGVEYVYLKRKGLIVSQMKLNKSYV